MELQGIVVSALVGNHPSSLVSAAQPAITLDFQGVVGDRHYGWTRPADSRVPQYKRGTPIRNSRQVSMVSAEELAEVAQRMGLPELRPEWLGANLSVQGVPGFSLLPPGTRLSFSSGAVLVVEGTNHPCTYAGAEVQRNFPDREDLAQAFPKSALYLRGVVAWVEHPGPVAAQDTFQVQMPKQPAHPAA